MSFVKFDTNWAKKHRQDFPSLSRRQGGRPLAFFDGPGGSQTPTPVIEAVRDYYNNYNSNTHGEFATTRETDEMLLSAREATAEFLGAPSWKCISFGANMTTLNFSLSHALAKDMEEGDEIVITELDHEANRSPWLNLAQYGVVIKEVRLLPSGVLDYDDMKAKITDRTKIVAVGMSSNAIGTVNDIATARALSASVGARLVIDAVHYAPHKPLDVQAIDADFLLCSAYKFYGPHVGILYSRPGLLDSLKTDALSTQVQEAPYKIETGTLNHAAIAGARAAVNYIASLGEGPNRRLKIVSAMEAISSYEHELAGLYYEEVGKIPGVRVWGPDFSGDRVPTVSITIDGVTPADAARKFGEQGLLLWNGSFYAAKAIEVLGQKDTGGVIRAGISLYNINEEVERLLDAVKNIK